MGRILATIKLFIGLTFKFLPWVLMAAIIFVFIKNINKVTKKIVGKTSLIEILLKASAFTVKDIITFLKINFKKIILWRNKNVGEIGRKETRVFGTKSPFENSNRGYGERPSTYEARFRERTEETWNGLEKY